MAEPNIDRASPLIKSPQQFGLGIADPFGQCIRNLADGVRKLPGELFVNLSNCVGKIPAGHFSHLLNGVGKVLFGRWLTSHTQLNTIYPASVPS